MTSPALELKNVSAGYGATHVLNDMSFTLDHGERLAIIGRNGVGKTTTLSTIMGLTRLHGGEVHLDGTPVQGLKPFERARRGLGLVAQTRDIFPSLSVEENLIAGAQGAVDLKRAYALFPQLEQRRNNGGAQLSGGEQQMLAIARTLMGDPDILLLDEPLEGLAPVICDQLMAVFETLAGDGRHTIVLVEQHAEMAVEFADKVLILDGGRIVWQGAASDIEAHPEILERHVGLALHGTDG